MINQVKQGQSIRTNTKMVSSNYVTGLNPSLLVWELIDNNGVVWGNGNGSLETLPTLLNNNEYLFLVWAEVHVPEDIPPTDTTTSYTLKYIMKIDGVFSYSLDDVEVLPNVVEHYGARNVLETPNVASELLLYSPSKYQNVELTILNVDAPVINVVDAGVSYESVSKGYLYKTIISTETLSPDINPYTITWVCKGFEGLSQDTEFGKLYIIKPSIWMIAKDVEALIQRHVTTIAGQVDIVFTPDDLMTFLRLGRDMFNSMYVATYYTMMGAEGSVRYFWTVCSAISALRAQYLAEGLKAFDFSGQNVTLTVDRSQFYQQMADMLEQSIRPDVERFKSAAAKRGNIAGDGSNASMRKINIGSVGISRSAISKVASSTLYGMSSTYSNVNTNGNSYIRLVW